MEGLVHKSEKIKGLGIAGFVLGILSIVFSLSIPLFGGIFGIVGLIFTLIQKRKSKTEILKIALILNIIGLVLSILIFIYSLILANQTAQYLEQYYNTQTNNLQGQNLENLNNQLPGVQLPVVPTANL